MFDGDGSKRTPDLGVFGALTALVICLIIVAVLAYGSGSEDQRRDQTRASYSHAAKEDAKRACAGAEPAAMFECVYEKVEASQEQAHDEQDLSAQQRAASSALVTAIISLLTLLISGIGLWFIYGTLGATREAVVKAGEGTDAANAAVEQARQAIITTENIGIAQVRAYTSLKYKSAIWDGGNECTIAFDLVNSGQSPARRLHIFGWTRDTDTGMEAAPILYNVGDVSSGEKREIAKIPINFPELGEFKGDLWDLFDLKFDVAYKDVFLRDQRDEFWFHVSLMYETNTIVVTPQGIF